MLWTDSTEKVKFLCIRKIFKNFRIKKKMLWTDSMEKVKFLCIHMKI